MASIDFDDFEPVLTPASASIVADCPYFIVTKHDLSSPLIITAADDFSIITCLTGEIKCDGVTLKPGGFMLVPASVKKIALSPQSEGTSYLVTRLPVA